MPVSARVMDRTLVHKLGFVREERRHRVYCLEVNGVTVAQTLISHGARDIDTVLLGLMARQMGVSQRQLRGIVDCSVTRNDYLRIVQAEGQE